MTVAAIAASGQFISYSFVLVAYYQENPDPLGEVDTDKSGF